VKKTLSQNFTYSHSIFFTFFCDFPKPLRLSGKIIQDHALYAEPKIVGGAPTDTGTGQDPSAAVPLLALFQPYFKQ